MAKENRFNKNHPIIDPNDPAILITAGLGSVVEPANDEVKEEIPSVQRPVQESQQTVRDQSDGDDTVYIPLDEIGQNQKPRKRTSSMYLSDDVLDELGKRAKKAKLKPSAYLDELLRRAFGL